MKKIFSKLKSKGIAFVASAICACSMMAVTASAQVTPSPSSPVDYSQITTAMSTGLKDAASGVMSMVSTVTPIGVGIFGITWSVGKGKQVFRKLT